MSFACQSIVSFAFTDLFYSCTEPNAFFLDVFYNAHPLSPSDSKEKQRASNALVPTSIAYAGGQVDLAVGMTQVR